MQGVKLSLAWRGLLVSGWLQVEEVMAYLCLQECSSSLPRHYFNTAVSLLTFTAAGLKWFLGFLCWKGFDVRDEVSEHLAFNPCSPPSSPSFLQHLRTFWLLLPWHKELWRVVQGKRTRLRLKPHPEDADVEPEEVKTPWALHSLWRRRKPRGSRSG